MTVSVTDNTKRFHGADSIGPFTWTWRFLDNADIQVYLIAIPNEADISTEIQELLVENVDYVLTGAGTYTGGSITLTDALATGADLLIERSTSLLQEVSIRNQGNNFRPEIHEDIFDRLTMIAQDRMTAIDDNATEIAGLKPRVTNLEDTYDALANASSDPWSAILYGAGIVVVPGNYATLEDARTDSGAAGKTVLILSALTETQSNISGVWPTDRALKIEKGGSIANSTAFTISGSFEAGLYQVFTGAGTVTFSSGVVSAVYPEWWSSDGVGINKAILSIKNTGIPNSAYGFTRACPKVVLTAEYNTNTAINMYSGVVLEGIGITSAIIAVAPFTGTNIIELNTTSGYCSNFEISNFSIKAPALNGLYGVKAIAVTVTFANIHDLTIESSYGIALNTYTQESIIDNIEVSGNSTATVERVLILAGNQNRVTNVSKEGGSATPSTTDPYVELLPHGSGDSNGNYLGNITIEGVVASTKPAYRFYGSDSLTLNNLWMEGVFASPSLIIDYCKNVVFTGVLNHTTLIGQVSISNKSFVHFDHFNVDGVDIAWNYVMTVDATSNVTIDNLYSRKIYNAQQLNTYNVQIKRQISRTIFLVPEAGKVPFSEYQDLSSGNLLYNPSFESGMWGWTLNTAATTTEFIASEVSNGLMGHFVWATASSPVLYQSITIPAQRVGIPHTFSCKVRRAAGSSPNTNPYASGCGITQTTSWGGSTGSSLLGWSVINFTVVPQSAGTLNIGVSSTGTLDLAIDDCKFGVGMIGHAMQENSRQIVLNDNVYTSSTAAPTIGTWKVGDYVKNKAPVVGQPKGWYCTVAGTPGTWVSEGNL